MLQRIEPGRYRSPCGRFEVRYTYSPDGAIWTRQGRRSGPHWLIIDNQATVAWKRLQRRYTLADCREHVAAVLARA